MGGQDSGSQFSPIVVSWCLPGCGSAGSTLHVFCNLAKRERSLGNACAVCFCSCTLVLLSSLFCYVWTPHGLALVGTLIKYTNRSIWVGNHRVIPSLDNCVLLWQMKAEQQEGEVALLWPQVWEQQPLQNELLRCQVAIRHTALFPVCGHLGFKS